MAAIENTAISPQAGAVFFQADPAGVALMERGITVAQGRRKLERELVVILEGKEVHLSQRVHSLLTDMRAEWRELDRRSAWPWADFHHSSTSRLRRHSSLKT